MTVFVRLVGFFSIVVAILSVMLGSYLPLVQWVFVVAAALGIVKAFAE